MVKINLVVRELGKLKPDYSLDFELPEVPAIGSYISIQRPDHPEPFWGRCNCSQGLVATEASRDRRVLQASAQNRHFE